MRAKNFQAAAPAGCFGELFLLGLVISARMSAFLSGLPTLFFRRIRHRSSVGIR
jgi:hypothetical protein